MFSELSNFDHSISFSKLFESLLFVKFVWFLFNFGKLSSILSLEQFLSFLLISLPQKLFDLFFLLLLVLLDFCCSISSNKSDQSSTQVKSNCFSFIIGKSSFSLFSEQTSFSSFLELVHRSFSLLLLPNLGHSTLLGNSVQFSLELEFHCFVSNLVTSTSFSLEISFRFLSSTCLFIVIRCEIWGSFGIGVILFLLEDLRFFLCDFGKGIVFSSLD